MTVEGFICIFDVQPVMTNIVLSDADGSCSEVYPMSIKKMQYEEFKRHWITGCGIIWPTTAMV